MSYFGTHINLDLFKNNIHDFCDFILSIKKSGVNLVQFMPITNLSISNINTIKNYLQYNNIKSIVHASYTINIARHWDQYSNSIMQFESEIIFAHNIGSYAIVIHFGKQMDMTLSEAYNNMFSFLVFIHNKTKNFDKLHILLETPAGQGTELCFSLENLAYFYKKIKNANLTHRFKLCIDTCHIFNAGYDITSAPKIKQYLDAFEELIGIKYISLIHLNDSKNSVGSKKDRHANIGMGHIGTKGLQIFYKFAHNNNIPVLLENPNVDHAYIKKILSQILV